MEIDMEYENNGIIESLNNCYEYYDSQYKGSYNRKLIDGSITGCGKCVGYCMYEGHPGFLTHELRKKHDCLHKKCIYYLAKEKNTKKPKERLPHIRETVLDRAKQLLSNVKGIKIVQVKEGPEYQYIIQFIAITNDYNLIKYATLLSDEFNSHICFQRLSYDFDVCCAMFMSN
jgi:hypothetical protein